MTRRSSVNFLKQPIQSENAGHQAFFVPSLETLDSPLQLGSAATCSYGLAKDEFQGPSPSSKLSTITGLMLGESLINIIGDARVELSVTALDDV